jgi:hypothetical protein
MSYENDENDGKKKKKKRKSPSLGYLDADKVSNTNFSPSELCGLISKLLIFAHYYAVRDSKPKDAMIAVTKVLSAASESKVFGKETDDERMMVMAMKLDDDTARKLLSHAVAAARFMLMTRSDRDIEHKSVSDLETAIRTILVHSVAFSKDEYKLDGVFSEGVVDEAQKMFDAIVGRVKGNRPDSFPMCLGDFERIMMGTMKASLKIMKEDENEPGPDSDSGGG